MIYRVLQSFALLLGGEWGIRTPGTVIPYGSLANCWFQPLTQLSGQLKRCFQTLSGDKSKSKLAKYQIKRPQNVKNIPRTAPIALRTMLHR